MGTHIARLLSAEGQNVTVIEADPERLEQIDYSLDVSTLAGDGNSVMLLQANGVGAADLFVASMGSDEVNLIAAAIAKGLGAKKVVARVDNTKYMDSTILYETVLGLDYALSPEALSAVEIANYIENPGILASEDFGRGLIHMRQIHVTHTPTARGKTLQDVMAPGGGVLVGVVEHRGTPRVAHGGTVIETGDNIILVGERDKMAATMKLFRGEEVTPRNVAIMGGGTIGFRLAKALEGKIKRVKLFERRQDRSDELARALEKTRVVCTDATSRSSLEQEQIDRCDMFVATTNDDERNIMAAVLAKELGVKAVLAVVHHPDFAPLVERLGIDMAITPRASMANRILRLVHQDKVTSLAVLAEGRIEVVEMEVGDGSPVLGGLVRDANLPKNSLIAAILRGDQVIVPSGDDRILAGDSVVLIANADTLKTARKKFQKTT